MPAALIDGKNPITHCFSFPVAMNDGLFPTVIEVGRNEQTGQFEIFASLGVPGNSPSINELNIADISDIDIRQIMKIAMARMIEDHCTCVIFELTVNPSNGMNLIQFI
jgi:hypothetical protein